MGLTGGPEGRTLIRRASRMAAKGSGSEILAVYIARSDGLTSASPKELTVQRTLVEDLGGSFHHVIGDDIPAALLEFARGVNATQIVLGSSRRKTWQYVYGPGVGATVARESGPDLDVHIVTHEEVAKGRGLPIARGARLGRARIIWGWLVGVVGPLLLAVVLRTMEDAPGLANDVLLFLFLTVAAALLGGLRPALASAAVGCMLLNYWFTPPTHTWTVQDPENLVAIVIFFAVAVAVSSVVDLAARRTHQAARLRAESEILSFLAGSVLRGETALDALLERVRETFAMESVALLERSSDVEPWTRAGAVGPAPVSRPDDADVDMPVGDNLALALSGRVLPAEDRRVLARSPPRPPSSSTASAWWARPSRPAGSPRATGSGPPCSPPSATTCAPRSPRSRPPSARCAPTTWPGPTRTRRSSWRASRTAPTGSTTSSGTCSTCPASRPAR